MHNGCLAMFEDFRVPSRNQTNDLHWDTRTPGELGHFTRFFTQSFPLAQLAPQYKFYSMLNINTIWKVLEIFASQKQFSPTYLQCWIFFNVYSKTTVSLSFNHDLPKWSQYKNWFYDTLLLIEPKICISSQESIIIIVFSILSQKHCLSW